MGKTASSGPLQLISASPSYPAPYECASDSGRDNNSLALLGANDILGIGDFQENCGPTCGSFAVATMVDVRGRGGLGSRVPALAWVRRGPRND